MRPSLVRLLVLGLLVQTAGCDLLAPEPRLSVDLDVVSTSIQGAADYGEPHLACFAILALAADGEKGASAVWTELGTELYAGLDRDQPTHQSVQAPADRQDGPIRLQPGDTLHWEWGADWDRPFYTVLTARFETGGREEAVSVEFSCGAPREVTPPPHGAALELPTGAPEAGTQYAAVARPAAVGGIWSLRLELAGAVTDTRPIILPRLGLSSLSVDLAEYLWLPWETTIGEDLELRLIVTDMLGQTTTGEWEQAGPVQDTRGPILRSLHAGDAVDGSGQVRIGEMLRVRVSAKDATDFYLIAAVGQPVLFRDSVLVPAGDGRVELLLPADSTWAGAQTVRAWARDTLGHRSGPVGPTEFFAYPKEAIESRSATVDGPVTDILFDADRNVLYLARPDTPLIARRDPVSLQPLSDIHVSAPVASLDLSPGGDSLIALVYGSSEVLVVDPDGLDPESVVPLTAHSEGFLPRSVRVHGDGTWVIKAVVDDMREYNAEILAVEPATGAQRVFDRRTGSRPSRWHGVVRSDDRSVIAVPGLYLALQYRGGDTLTWTRFGGRQPLGLDATGSRMAGLRDVFEAGDRIRRDLRLRQSVEASDLSPDGELFYAVTADGIEVVSVEQWQPLRLLAGEVPTGEVQVSPDGTWLLVWGWDDAGPDAEDTPLLRVELP